MVLVAGDDDVLAYERRDGDVRLLIVLNFSNQRRMLILPTGAIVAGVLASTLPPRALEGVLEPDEGLVLRLGSAR